VPGIRPCAAAGSVAVVWCRGSARESLPGRWQSAAGPVSVPDTGNRRLVHKCPSGARARPGVGGPRSCDDSARAPRRPGRRRPPSPGAGAGSRRARHPSVGPASRAHPPPPRRLRQPHRAAHVDKSRPGCRAVLRRCRPVPSLGARPGRGPHPRGDRAPAQRRLVAGRGPAPTHPAPGAGAVAPVAPRLRVEDAALDVAGDARTTAREVDVVTEICNRRATTPQRLLDALAERRRTPRGVELRWSCVRWPTACSRLSKRAWCGGC
jgi:hypothetical protein